MAVGFVLKPIDVFIYCRLVSLASKLMFIIEAFVVLLTMVGSPWSMAILGGFDRDLVGMPR